MLIALHLPQRGAGQYPENSADLLNEDRAESMKTGILQMIFVVTAPAQALQTLIDASGK
jgi:hypothetical protein